MALALTAGPYVFSAASLVAKKAFEALASRSLRGITQVLTERYKGDAQVIRLRNELEVKLSVLALPLDICVQHSVRGNSALQGALTAALSVLGDIESLEDALRREDINKARDEPESPQQDSTVAARKLEGLIRRLDSLLPYLNIAISAIGLLEHGRDHISPSRLLAASWDIRSAPKQPHAQVMAIQHAKWHVQGLQSTSGKHLRPMQNEFPLCQVIMRRGPAEAADEADSGGGMQGDHASSLSFELLIQQDLEDGLHHEDDEIAGQQLLSLDRLISIEWATSQSLKLGENDFQPALLLQFATDDGALSLAARTQEASETSAASASRPARTGRDHKPSPFMLAQAKPGPGHPSSIYAIQVASPEDEGFAPDHALQHHWAVLSQLEYVMRLCHLEARDECPHTQIADERLHMAFGAADPAMRAPPEEPDPSTPRMTWRSRRSLSPTPSYQSAASATGRGDSGSIGHLAAEFESVAFGSPVSSQAP